MCKFLLGNIKSLSQPGIRDALLEFHKKWYSANIMTLSVIGKFQITELENWVTEKFSPVANKDVVLPDLSIPEPYPPSHMGKLIRFVPNNDQDMAFFNFQVPYSQKEQKSNPLNYLTKLIGHEGEYSLLSYLKNEGLALELYTNQLHWGDCYTIF